MEKLSELEKKIKYSFKNQQLLHEALTHKSISEKNNQRLEFLGDAVLQICISEYLFSLFSRHQEGDLTKLRASLVCKNTLAAIGKTLSIGSYVMLDSGFAKQGGRGNAGVIADAVEALLAAVYLDGGIDAARETVMLLWEHLVSSASPELDIKGKLQRLTQANGLEAPQYALISSRGPVHDRKFTMAVFLEDKELARSEASSKKEAEKKAAEIAYRNFLAKGDLNETKTT